MGYGALLAVITLTLYGTAAALYMWSLLRGSSQTHRLASLACLLGLTSHSVMIVLDGIQLRRAPFMNMHESLVFTAWALMAIYLIIEHRYRFNSLGIFASLLALATVAFSVTLPRGIAESLRPELNSPWSSVHIGSTLVSFASFTLAFGASIGYVLQEYLLKAKRLGALHAHLPSLDTLDRLGYKLVTFGFFMLTLGVVTGSVWAQAAWGSYWNWNPKEIWALITWVVYAMYLHVRVISGWRGKWANRLLITGFACILITYWGISFLAPGWHSYRW